MSHVTLALRSLLASPAHTCLVVVCLALGLTLNIVAFSVAHALIFGEMPGITSRMSIVRLSLQHSSVFGAETVGGQVIAAGPFSRGDFRILESTIPAAMTSVAAERRRWLRFVQGDHRGIVRTASVTDTYFETLGTSAASGRLLRADDHQPGASPVAVVGDHFWRTTLGGRADVIGTSLTLDGHAATIVGVAPARFTGIQPVDVGESPTSGVQIWQPLQIRDMSVRGIRWSSRRYRSRSRWC